MSDIMRPMAFEQLLNWILTEKKQRGTVFGTHHPYYAEKNMTERFSGVLLRRLSVQRPDHTPSWRRISLRHTIREAVSSN